MPGSIRKSASISSIIMTSPKKTAALFFGSFNPVHVGHMVIAQQVLNEELANEVWFVVSPHNPHKEKHTLLADHHRLALVREAVYDQPKFRVSDIEFHLDQPSYTVNTLVHLREKYPDIIFKLIMGEDNLRTFYKWKNPEEILKYHQLIVYRRRKYENETESEGVHAELPEAIWMKGEMLDISSTYIRRLIAEGNDARFYLTEPVHKYVMEMGFYKK
ncbi:MAG: nicotinate (nicotinamide) nucleotide adenylyltransferase [Flavobacteriales bacterium]